MSLNVLHVVSSLEPNAGSLSFCLPGLFRELKSAGIDSRLVALKTSTTSVDVGETVLLPSVDLTAYVNDCDVVHCHGDVEHETERVLSAARSAGKRSVLSPAGGFSADPFQKTGWWGRRRRQSILRRRLRDTTTASAISRCECDELTALGMNGHVPILPYGFDFNDRVSRLGDHAESRSSRLILVLAAIHPIEGLVPLFRALTELGPVFDGWHVALAGPRVGDWQNQIEAAVNRRGYAGRVSVVADPTPAVQDEWLSRADLLVDATLRPHPPTSVQRGIAAGVPLLSSPFSLPPDLDSSVRRCQPTQGDLRSALHEMLVASDADRRNWASLALQHARATWDWCVIAPRFVELYSRLVSV